MAKAKNNDKTLRERVFDWVKAQGNDPEKFSLANCLGAFKGESQSSIRQYHLLARKELGLSKGKRRRRMRSGVPAAGVSGKLSKPVKPTVVNGSLVEDLATLQGLVRAYGADE